MALQEIYFIAEIVAAVAVVASLIFVGVQLRQNTGTMKATVGNQSVENWLLLGKEIPLNGDFAEIFHRGSLNFPGDLNSLEQRRILLWFLTNLKSAELSYLYWLDGSLDDRLWQGIDQGLRVLFSFPGIQTIWDDDRVAAVSAEFRTYLATIRNEA